jgi:hypothetical protein
LIHILGNEAIVLHQNPQFKAIKRQFPNIQHISKDEAILSL